MKNKVIVPFCFEKLKVTGDTFLAMMREHCYVRTVFQLGDAPPHFSHHVCAILDLEFPDY